MRLTHLDLFSGLGGFALAAEWAGFETIGFAETEPYCCALLAEKWPQIKNYGDIRNTEFFWGLANRICVCSAGVPCQPASLAGKRRGANDDRWLWPATLALVELIRPAWCIFENPLGILSLDEFGGVLLHLESLGYAFRAFSVPANALGAKHRRQRIFLIANNQGKRRSGLSIGKKTPYTMFGSSGKTLADTDRGDIRTRRDGRRTETGEWPLHEFTGPSQDAQALADSHERRLRRTGSLWQTGHVAFSSEAVRHSDEPGLEERERVRKNNEEKQSATYGTDGWLAQPGVRRVAHGFSNWLDVHPYPLAQGKIQDRAARLKALGNAVVPQVAFRFFEAIAQTYEH